MVAHLLTYFILVTIVLGNNNFFKALPCTMLQVSPPEYKPEPEPQYYG